MLTDSFHIYSEDRGKAHNTVLSYVRTIVTYSLWYQESLGAEVQRLYRANILDYISYLRTVKQLSNRSLNSKLAALLCFNEFLVSTGVQTDIVLGKRDYLREREGGRLDRSAINRVFNDYSDRITPHTLRHYFCSAAIEAGYSIAEVANQAGHSNVHTSLIYTNPTREKMKEKANLL